MAQSKRGRPSKAEAERRRQEQILFEQQRRRSGIRGYVFLFLGLIICALAFVEGKSVWEWLRNALFGIFGVFAFAVGPLTVFCAVKIAYGKKPVLGVVLKCVFLFLVLAGAIYIWVDPGESTFINAVRSTFRMGSSSAGLSSAGGVCSVILGWSLYQACGVTAAKIVICILTFLALMVITGKTIIDVINDASAARLKIKDRVSAGLEVGDFAGPDVPRKMENIDIPIESRAQKIDVPLGQSGMSTDARGPLFLGRRKKEKVSPPVAQSVKDAALSRIDINLGPDPVDQVDDSDILPLDFGSRATGPAAAFVQDIRSTDTIIKNTFTDFSSSASGTENKETIPLVFPDDDPVLDPVQEESEVQPVEKIESAVEENNSIPKPGYVFPPLDLLKKGSTRGSKSAEEETKANAELLINTLDSFNIRAHITDIARGPSVTRYELQPEAGIRLSRIVSLSNDLALALAADGVRIEAPIPGKAAVGIEVPNKNVSTVNLRSALEKNVFTDAKSPMTMALGMEISGDVRVGDIAKMPHLLIAGSTGMGKSVCINSIIVSLVYKASPEDVQMILIDPKMVEFSCYTGLPHLYIPVVTDVKKAAGALGAAVGEMMKRYNLFSSFGVRNIDEYNSMVKRKYTDDYVPEEGEEVPEHKPSIVIIIDELADLMMTAPADVENSISRIAQMGRAAGIHLIVATQRPSVDVITGTIKNNIPSRIAFKVSSQIDSRTILDTAGAEKLIGRGDMLFLPVGQTKPVRIQGCYVDDEEVAGVVSFVKMYANASYNEQFANEAAEAAANLKIKGPAGDVPSEDDGETDPQLENAIEVVVEAGQASVSLLQRKLKLGYARAARVMDQLEARGVVGPQDGSKPRTVNMTRQQLLERQQTISG